jgi:hypothetical protein
MELHTFSKNTLKSSKQKQIITYRVMKSKLRFLHQQLGQRPAGTLKKKTIKIPSIFGASRFSPFFSFLPRRY